MIEGWDPCCHASGGRPPCATMAAMPAGDVQSQPEARLDYRLRQIAFPPVSGRRQSEVLLVVRRRSQGYMMMRKRSYPRTAFRLPTGGLKRGESPHAALLRETYEETGLQVDVQRYMGELRYHRWADGRLEFTSHVFLVEEVSGTFGPTDDSEGIDGWLEVDAAGVLAQAAVLEEIHTGGSSGIDWNPWGKFRGLGHRFVFQALGGATWQADTLISDPEFATVEVRDA